MSRIEGVNNHILKENPFFSSYDLIVENAEAIEKAYFLEENLVFEKTIEGLVNPPILVFKNGKTIPIGVIKAAGKNETDANVKLNALESLKSKGFVHIPTVYKNTQGEQLTKIEDLFFYYMQFIPADAAPITLKQFLDTTGGFHQHAKMISYPDELSIDKLNEYQSRSHFFHDPWFSTYNPAFSDPLWEKIIDLSHYFLSSDFQKIYHNLPIQLIHGDNNQTNVILSNQIAYLIDFDSLRYDVRLLDLTSYFRYGGFDDYLTLTKKKHLYSVINDTYGKNAGLLTKEEKSHFHLLMAFSHIEFISWILHMLKQYDLEGNKEKTEDFLNYILLYKEQTNKVMDILAKRNTR
jgi:hypothetical protein